MATKLMGPNDNFVPKFHHDKGDVKVGSGPATKLESVNHEDFEGRQRIPDTNPGAGEQNHEVHGTNPAEKGRLSGMHQPKIGGSDESVSKEKGLNTPPRAFKYSREGHAVDRGSISENAAM